MADRNENDRNTGRGRDTAREHDDLPYGQDRPYTDRHVARGAYYGGVSDEANRESPARQRYEEYRRQRDEGGLQGHRERGNSFDPEDAYRRTAEYDMNPYGRGDYGSTFDEGYGRSRHLQASYRRAPGAEHSMDRSEEYPGRYLDQGYLPGQDREFGGTRSTSGQSHRDYGANAGAAGGLGTEYHGGRSSTDQSGLLGTGGLGAAFGTPQPLGRFSGRGPKGYQRSDERIREDVCERLTHHGEVDASDMEVRVENGEVTLTGHVGDRSQKRLAEDATHEISGVREVHNHLRVSGNQPRP